MTARIVPAAILILCLPFLAVCGDDGADDTASPTGSPAAAACSQVGEDLAGGADETVDVDLDDYAFDPSDIEVAAGTVTFRAANVGDEPHELAFLPGGGEVPFTDDGVPDEEALAEAGAFELEAFPPGETCEATYELEPGTYTIFCIVESDDGETHYEKGMEGILEVT